MVSPGEAEGATVVGAGISKCRCASIVVEGSGSRRNVDN